MKKKIAIIAPLIDSYQLNLDFSVRLNSSHRDLSLISLYELADGGFNTSNPLKSISNEDDTPSAGYYLQGVLSQNGYDTFLTNKYSETTLKQLAANDLFAVCVSTTMITTSESFINLLSAIRKHIPNVPIIAGGMFLFKHYLQYERFLKFPDAYPLYPQVFFHPLNSIYDADVLIVSEHGILSFLAVLDELGKGSKGDFEYIPNLCLKRNGGFYFTKRISDQIDYNEDFTRWDLIQNMPEKIPFRTSIGCPYRCGFCDFCMISPRLFLRSSESLKRELQLINQRLNGNAALIHVSDDNVFITKKRLFEVCDVFNSSGFGNWISFMRGGDYSVDELKAMQNSGLRMGMIGVESGDQEMLNRMNKKQQVEKVKAGIEQLDSIGINILMTFVVGYPGEDANSLSNTIAFLNGLNLTNHIVSYQVYPLHIYHLAEIAEPAVRKKWEIKGFMDNWSHSTMNSNMALHACHQIFRAVNGVTYNYAGESHFFNRSMFDAQTLSDLYNLRHLLTTKLMDKAPWTEVEEIIRQMVLIMELPADGIEKLKNELTINQAILNDE